MSPAPVTVAGLSIAPVKGLGVVSRDRVAVGPAGVPQDRRFFMVDDSDHVLTGRDAGALLPVAAECDAAAERLALRLPDGREVAGPVRLGEPLATTLYDKVRSGRLVAGPFAGALTGLLGRPVRLVRSDEVGNGWDEAPVTLVSRATVEEVARHAGLDAVDARRFRATALLAGPGPREEEAWVGRELRIGSTRLRAIAKLVRCAVITKSPDTGERDWDGLRVLAGYRGKDDVCLGILAEVVEPGEMAVGDAVAVGP